MVEYFALALYLNIMSYRLFNKRMKLLTYTSYKEHFDLYTVIHDSIAVNSCQNELPQKTSFYYQKSP